MQQNNRRSNNKRSTTHKITMITSGGNNVEMSRNAMSGWTPAHGTDSKGNTVKSLQCYMNSDFQTIVIEGHGKSRRGRLTPTIGEFEVLARKLQDAGIIDINKATAHNT